MIESSLDTARSILYLRPKSALKEEDFIELGKTVDPYIQSNGDLAGIIVEAAGFPGWDSLGAMAAHLRFVRDHHKRIRKIAVVTDASLGSLAEKLGAHFVSATIKHFPAGSIPAAQQWIMST